MLNNHTYLKLLFFKYRNDINLYVYQEKNGLSVEGSFCNKTLLQIPYRSKMVNDVYSFQDI
jgi:hypothetical protein